MNLEALGITKQEIIDKIVDKFTTELFNDEYIINNVRAQAEKIYKDKLAFELNEKITSLVDKAMKETFNIVYQPVDKWGDKDGKQTTLKEQMEKEMLSWWSQKVDREGKPTSSSYQEVGTRAGHLVRSEIESFLRNKANEEMVSVMKTVRESINTRLQEVISAVIKQQFTPLK